MKTNYIIQPTFAVLFLSWILFISLTSCFVQYDPYNPHGPRQDLQPYHGPIIEAAKASCFTNYTYDDFMWYFDAWIHYPRHDYEEIIDVYVEVYEGPYMIDWFPLYHDHDKFWTSSWIEKIETNLYCGGYYHNYEVDFIAVDYQGNYDVVTTRPYY
jgi:hypothetical protein